VCHNFLRSGHRIRKLNTVSEMIPVKVLKKKQFEHNDIKREPGNLLTKLRLPGDIVYCGEVVNGSFHGVGCLHVPRGVGETQTPGLGKTIEYLGEFKNNMYAGHGCGKYANGSQFSGQWEEGKWHGYGVLSYPDGSRFVGKFIHGIPDDFGECISRKGVSYLGKHSKNEFKIGKCSQRGGFTWTHRENHAIPWQKETERTVTSQEGEFGISSRGNLCLQGRGLLRFSDGDTVSGVFVDGTFQHQSPLPADSIEVLVNQAVAQAVANVTKAANAVLLAEYNSREAAFYENCHDEPHKLPCGNHSCKCVDNISRSEYGNLVSNIFPSREATPCGDKKFGVCGKCKWKAYCTRECQQYDFKAGHKFFCNANFYKTIIVLQSSSASLPELKITPLLPHKATVTPVKASLVATNSQIAGVDSIKEMHRANHEAKTKKNVIVTGTEAQVSDNPSPLDLD
jgi:hypothetical protein